MTGSRSQSVPAGSNDKWVSAIGSGGYHYRRCHNDNWRARRDEGLNRIRQQIADEKKYWSSFDFLHHEYREYDQKPAIPGVTVEQLPMRLKRFTPYDVNRKVYYAAVGGKPMMEQPVESGHWLMQVNTRANSYDIISNREPNPHVAAHTRAEKESRKHEFGPLFGDASRRRRDIDYHSVPAGTSRPPAVVTFTQGRRPPPVVGIDIRDSLGPNI